MAPQPPQCVGPLNVRGPLKGKKHIGWASAGATEGPQLKICGRAPNRLDTALNTITIDVDLLIAAVYKRNSFFQKIVYFKQQRVR